MAKLSARGNRAIVKMNAKSPTSGSTLLFALRSDGKVLRRWTGDLSTGYSWFTTLKKDAPLTEATLRKLVESMGYTVTKVTS